MFHEAKAMIMSSFMWGGNLWLNRSPDVNHDANTLVVISSF